MPSKILIVDGNSANRIVLRAKLSAAFYLVCRLLLEKKKKKKIKKIKPERVRCSAALPDMAGDTFRTTIKII